LIDIQKLKIMGKLGTPVILGMISGNLLSLVDTAMVGRLGSTALAAVGYGGFTYGLGMALISGISFAVQTMTARRFGEKKYDEMHQPLNGGIYVGATFGLVATVLSVWLAPHFFALLTGDQAVVTEGVRYLKIVLFGLLGTGLASPLIGFWNGSGKTGIHLKILIATQAANVALNYILIYGKLGAPAMGVAGAGLASVISLYLGVLGYMILMYLNRPVGFLTRLPSKLVVKRILRLMIPSGIQAASRSIGALLILYIIGKIGTTEVAATSIILRIMALTDLPIAGIGVACSILAGQALGRKEPEAATQWGWDAAKVGSFCLLVLGLPQVLFPETILHVFVTDPHLIQVAKWPIVFLGAFRFLGLNPIMTFLLLGVGDNKNVMYIAVFIEWVLLYPILLFAVLYLKCSFFAIWVITFIISLAQLGLLMGIWYRGKWKLLEL